jgi:basic amino acid/polyamine antiporter, APA family
MHTAENTKSPALIRGLGLWASTAIIIGSMVGQSIFLVTSDVAREIDSVGWVFAAWLVGGVIAYFGSLCYAELGAALPEAGGDYVYLRRALGPVWGFSFGWTSALLQRPAIAATLAAALMRFIGFLLPSVGTPIFTWHISVPFQARPYEFVFTVAQVGAASAVTAATLINYFGVRMAGQVQILLTGLKLGTALAIIALGLTVRRAFGVEPRAMGLFTHPGIGAFLAGLVPVLLAYDGFQTLTQVGGEVESPQKNIPRAVISGVLAVVVLYISMNLIYFRVLSLSEIASSQHVASDVVGMLAGLRGARWLTVLMMFSALGTLHASVLAGARAPYAMARDGQFFNFVKRVHPAFHTPSGALLLEGGFAVVLALTGTFQEIYSLGIFSISTFFVLTAIALIRLRTKEPTLPRPYRVWGYPWTPLLFAAAALAISVNLWLVRPVRSSIGLAIILLGIPLRRYWRRQTTRMVLKESATPADAASGPA